MVAAVLDDFGAIDTLVHSAGIASRGHTVADTDPAELERVIAIHALGAPSPVPARAAVDAQPARAATWCSCRAWRPGSWPPTARPTTWPRPRSRRLAMTLAKEERRHGIHVNVVAPGLVVTEMGRRLVRAMGVDDISTMDANAAFGRVCRPEDVAGVVRFLCSEEAGYLTGQVIAVDGGG